MHLPDNNNLGFVLVKFGDIGPEPVYFDNAPFEKDFEEVYGVQLGIYLSLMINKGNTNQSEFNLGLDGPYPWSQTPDHNIMTFTFLGKDPHINDSRAKMYGVFMILAIFFPTTNQELLKARISVENALSEFLKKESLEKYHSVEIEKISLLFAQIKGKTYNSLKEGDRIVQEKAMDILLSNDRLQYLGLYEAKTQDLIATIIGEESDFKDILNEGKNLKFEIFFTTFHVYRFGLIRLSKFNKIAIIILSKEEGDSIFMEEDFLELYQAIYVAAPLLEEYYGV